MTHQYDDDDDRVRRHSNVRDDDRGRRGALRGDDCGDGRGWRNH